MTNEVRLWDSEYNLIYSGPADKPIHWTQSLERGPEVHYFTGDIPLTMLPNLQAANTFIGNTVRYCGRNWEVLAVLPHRRNSLLLGRVSSCPECEMYELEEALWEEVEIVV